LVKLIAVLGAFLLCLGMVNAYTFSKEVEFEKEIEILIDANSINVSSDNFSWGRFVDGSSNYSTVLKIPLTIDVNEDFCPTLNETYVPLLAAYEKCDTNLVTALANTRTDLNRMIHSINYGTMESLLLQFGEDQNAKTLQYLTAHDSLLDSKLNDWWAKIELTLMPSTQELTVLKNELNACREAKAKEVGDFNSLYQVERAENMAMRNDSLPAIQAQADFFTIVSLLLSLALILMFANYLGAFDRFKQGGGE